MIKFNEEEYLDAREFYGGYCTECAEWTRDCTEPDAENYDCPECEQNTVIGAEMYLLNAA